MFNPSRETRHILAQAKAIGADAVRADFQRTQAFLSLSLTFYAVSYTHLDVYKRQLLA